ncbi:MAG: hypothetical protein RJQ04_06945 [Longimicrobiales bacterium]
MTNRPYFTPGARRLGIAAASGVVVVEIVYLVVLLVGLATLPSPDAPIGDPWFTALEVLILGLVPFLVLLMVCVHAWSAEETRPHGLAAALFMVLVAAVTSAVHLGILTLGRHDAFAGLDWLFSFTWPSVAYAMDILAWDLFFPLAAFSAMPVFGREPGDRRIRLALAWSGALALVGLAGAFLGDMRIRNIGILGYVGVFPVAVVLIGLRWRAYRPGTTRP